MWQIFQLSNQLRFYSQLSTKSHPPAATARIRPSQPFLPTGLAIPVKLQRTDSYPPRKDWDRYLDSKSRNLHGFRGFLRPFLFSITRGINCQESPQADNQSERLEEQQNHAPMQRREMETEQTELNLNLPTVYLHT